MLHNTQRPDPEAPAGPIDRRERSWSCPGRRHHPRRGASHLHSSGQPGLPEEHRPVRGATCTAYNTTCIYIWNALEIIPRTPEPPGLSGLRGAQDRGFLKDGLRAAGGVGRVATFGTVVNLPPRGHLPY
ncbi:hypothetical protein E2C01_004564 [Portunus trituberculatus]|uniref:Uncharacterized protein n=1 Tax=Portunus trituberculatus TaxID=210409 RepID=A0A5B7CQV2_PORTR|nr:hypothetical protein [Portunus trituberculatus]